MTKRPWPIGFAAFLKRAEHEDYYDTDTGFNPFRGKARSAA
jgi:hypothetical protein